MPCIMYVCRLGGVTSYLAGETPDHNDRRPVCEGEAPLTLPLLDNDGEEGLQRHAGNTRGMWMHMEVYNFEAERTGQMAHTWVTL